MKSTVVRWGALALIVGSLAGCGGGGGGTAAVTPTTPTTTPTTTVTPPAGVPQGGTNTVAATAVSAAAWKALQPQVTVTGVTINSPPVVKFTVKDAAGSPVVGLGNKSLNSSTGLTGLTNLGFTLAKLVPGTNGAPSKWVSYLVVRPASVAEKTAVPATSSCDAATNATWCGSYPTFDNQGTLIDFGDGSYQYTFYRDIKQAATIVASLIDSADGLSLKADLGDVSYDATATTRLGIQIGGNAPGTGSNLVDSTTLAPVSGAPAAVAMVNPANIVYDFRPDGAAVANTRDIVTIDSCSQCHAGKILNHGSRKDPNYCATCHTDQVKYSFDKEAPMLADGLTFAVQTGTNAQVRPNQAVVNGRAVGNLPNMIHHIHMGEDLVKQGYHYNNDDLGLFNEKRFPQDIRNCTTCHDGSSTAAHKTADGDNWKMVPSRLACGACHDGINFATGQGTTLADAALIAAGKAPLGFGHVGGAKADDSQCAICHDATTIPVYHIPVSPVDLSIRTSGVATGYTNAASIDANQDNLPAGAIKVTYAVSSVSRNAAMNPVIVFKLLQNGVATPFNDATKATELWANFIGTPSAQFVWAVPQDGITAPADFNKSASSTIKGLWNGTATGSKAGTLTYDATSGNYTATLTGVTVPDNAVMLTGGIGFTYDLHGSPATNNPPLTQTNVAGYPYDATSGIGGLIVAAPTQQMVASAGAAAGGTGGAYTARRQIVDSSLCNKCHKKLGVFTASAFHAGQRNDANTCAWCHMPNQSSSGWSADSEVFIHGIHAADKRSVPFTWHAVSATDNFAGIGYPGVLQKCETCHLPGTYDFSAPASNAALSNRLYRTVANSTLTAGVSTSPYVTVGTAYGASAAANLVSSPIAAACFACHDGKMVSDPTQNVVDHMQGMGNGSIYQVRGTPGSGNALDKKEACMLCHGPNSTIAPIAAMHAK